MRVDRETILALALGFVVIWFGVNELMDPAAWAGYVPQIAKDALKDPQMLNYMVMGHGGALVVAGLMVAFNFYRRLGAFVIFLMLLGIVATLISVSGLNEIAVRDIGLLGMALALALRN